MDHGKCPYLPELMKVTRVGERTFKSHIAARQADQDVVNSGKATSTSDSNRSDGVENGQLRRTSSLETIAESMIRRSPQVSSLKDFPPPAPYSTGRYCSDVSPSIPVVPKMNNRVTERLTTNRIQSWSSAFINLLKDHVGTQLFLDFVEKEFSAENLRFWLACQELKQTKRDNVPVLVNEIFREFFDEDSLSTINIDSKTYHQVKINLTNPSYNIFDKAQDHIFQLMKTDSYPRFIRSERYKQLLKDSSGSKTRKKTVAS